MARVYAPASIAILVDAHPRLLLVHRSTEPEALAHAIAEGLKRPLCYRHVETAVAARAASRLAALL